MTTKPKILLVCDSRENAEALLAHATESHEVVVANSLQAITQLAREPFAGVCSRSRLHVGGSNPSGNDEPTACAVSSARGSS